MASRPVDTGVEVKGQTVRLVVDGLDEHPETSASQGREFLAENGIEDPNPEDWYSLRGLVRTLDAVESEYDEEVLTHLGSKIPESVEWPSDVTSATGGFETVDEAYQLNHRGGDIGYYEFAEVGDRERRVTCANPYPCPFDRGIIQGTLRAFGEEFSYTPMVFVRETSDHCRAEGGTKCTYRVSW